MAQATNAAQYVSVLLSRQRWLPYKTRRSLIKRLYPAMLRDFRFDAPFFDPAWGMRFHGNLMHYVDRRIYFCGAFDKHVLLLLRDYITRLSQAGKAATCVDIGAGGGNHTLFLSRLAEKVYAFEPADRLRRQLEYNLSLNRIGNVTVSGVALGDHDGQVQRCEKPQRVLAPGESYHFDQMVLRCGDHILPELGCGMTQVVNINAGGHEAEVLRGLSITLAKDRPLIVVNLSDQFRKSLKNKEEFISFFPGRYRFYAFSHGHARRSYYRLIPFDYDQPLRFYDIIACPAEKRELLGL